MKLYLAQALISVKAKRLLTVSGRNLIFQDIVVSELTTPINALYHQEEFNHETLQIHSLCIPSNVGYDGQRICRDDFDSQGGDHLDTQSGNDHGRRCRLLHRARDEHHRLTNRYYFSRCEWPRFKPGKVHIQRSVNVRETTL